MITHGPQHLCFCTTIPFRDVLEAIRDTAFLVSDFPVILSFENHCSQKQQIVMAALCRQILGELLLTEPLKDYPIEAGVNLPSPNLLRRRILIKNKIEKRSPDQQQEPGQSAREMGSGSGERSLEHSEVSERSLDQMEKQVSIESSGSGSISRAGGGSLRIFIGETDEDDRVNILPSTVAEANGNGNGGTIQQPTVTELSGNPSYHLKVIILLKLLHTYECITHLDLVIYVRAMGKLSGFDGGGIIYFCTPKARSSKKK